MKTPPLTDSHAGGLLNEHLHGWEGVADWPETSRKRSLLQKRGHTSQISVSSPDVSQEHDIVTIIMIRALNVTVALFSFP